MAGTVLVTGAAGFVGSHLLQLLSNASTPTPIVAWRRPHEQARLTTPRPPRSFGDGTQVHWTEVDLLDRDQVPTALDAAQPAAIYHCAGAAAVHGSWDRTVPTLEANVRGTDHLLSAVRASRMRPKILIPGSALVYAPTEVPIRETDPLGPVSPYGLSKLAQEMLAQQFVSEGLNVVLTRSFTHFGPGQDTAYATSSFAHQIARIEAGLDDAVIKVGFLEARRDLTDVRDTVRAYRALMERGAAGQPYNVCTGEAYQVGDVLRRLVDRATVTIAIETDSARLRPSDNPILVGDPSRLTEEIGWAPTIPLDQSLRDLLDYSRRMVVEQGH